MPFTVETSTYNTETKTHDRFMEVRGVGTTLRVYNDHVQVMSDVWELATIAEYWDETEQRLRTQQWVSDAKVDATPEIKKKVSQWIWRKAFERAKGTLEADARKIVKGSVVKVVRGRQGKGTEGKVVVMIDRPYQMAWRTSVEPKLAIATSDVMIDVPARNGKVYKNHKDVVWAWARNCEMIEVPGIDLNHAKERADNEFEREMRRFG